MKGQRLNADDFVQQCEKVEAKIDYSNLDLGFKDGMGNYCKPNTVFNTGKKGEPFKEDLCDGSPMKKLLAQYNDGLKVFCAENNAEIFGAQGGIYKEVCPKELEENFLASYRKGRLVYLKGQISSQNSKINSLQQSLENKRKDKQMLNANLLTLRGGATITSKKAYDPKTKKQIKQTLIQEDPQTIERRRELENRIRRVEGEIRSSENEITRLKASNEAHQQEINAIELQIKSN
jgi:hypothetical protein